MDTTFTCTATSCGNPDKGQHPDRPISMPRTITANRLDVMRDELLRYIADHDLGGGNWPQPPILVNGVPTYFMSYNGCVWELWGRDENDPSTWREVDLSAADDH